MEEFIKDLLGFDSDERKRKLKEARNSITKIVDDCDCLLCITNKGIISAGTGAEILALISMATDELKNRGIPNDIIKEAFEFVFKDEEKKETKEKNDNNKKDIEQLKKIRKCIDDLTDMLVKED